VGASHIEASGSQTAWTTADPIPIGSGAVTEYKHVDLWHPSQSQLGLHWDSLYGVQTATVSLLTATLSGDGRKTGRLAVTWLPMRRRQASSQSPSRRRKEDKLARSCPAADAEKTDQLAVIWLLMQGRLTSQPAAPEVLLTFIGHSVLELQPFSGPTTPHWLPHTLPACLPVCLYILLTAINICYRNLHGCLSMLLEPTPHIVFMKARHWTVLS
jgi:hypothetical protein